LVLAGNFIVALAPATSHVITTATLSFHTSLYCDSISLSSLPFAVLQSCPWTDILQPFVVMLVGRVVFGTGSESIIISQSAVLVERSFCRLTERLRQKREGEGRETETQKISL
jgi:hypothetical protein